MRFLRSKIGKTVHCDQRARAPRCLSAAAILSKEVPSELTFIPDYFSLHEQCVLLKASLTKLDAVESRQALRHRKSLPPLPPCISPTKAADIFLPDRYYHFYEGHLDGVIRNYRETHLTAWPEHELQGLTPVLKRLYDLTPTRDVQTHLLHLASDGEIRPHVDNVTASGNWILGVSLGADRILRLESMDESDNYDVLLPSGSLYIQEGNLRYNYKHSILNAREFRGEKLAGGQRLSIMIRDLFRPNLV
ncbi:hypothetical protein GLOTRDRAFT_57321 [Gloeophyllum trabeum ATCC 11539]|uniref:Alpha-ketoglutarate-dependent dioxygenase AlkB-like domain-containing protein n=1 Tax=Gloeophyllum trabeum (strain ATCC 11539 / FP-39264 / Madison 617) TaxID=670483 RepID=S7QEX8_GLOTA|nr:uncharacterized protein GLOTRDRAFT_57321 [Gloeophyllum trabeum ATCC 11539]EPQ58381.1 hypothetical protein GLOTRDRAFT_57321 [Gloeophyllum trabeum ATCC 11539]